MTQSNRAKDPLDNILQKARAIEKNVTTEKETQIKNKIDDNNTRGVFRSRQSRSSSGAVDLTLDKNDIDYPQTQTDDILDDDTDSDFGNTRNSNSKRKRIRINEVSYNAFKGLSY